MMGRDKHKSNQACGNRLVHGAKKRKFGPLHIHVKYLDPAVPRKFRQTDHVVTGNVVHLFIRVTFESDRFGPVSPDTRVNPTGLPTVQ